MTTSLASTTKALNGLLLLCLLVSPLAAAEEAKEEAAKAAPFKTEEGYLLNLKAVDMALVLELYSRLTGKAVLPATDVQGKVNVINRERVSKEQAMATIESVLELNGFSTIVGEKVIKVVSRRNAVKRNIQVGRVEGKSVVRAADRVETLLLSLENIKVENAKAVITPLLSDVGNVSTDKDSNILVLTEVASNSSRLVRILRELDQAPERRRPILRSYEVKHGRPEDVARQLGAYFKTTQAAMKGNRDGGPEPTFTADKRVGAVLVTALLEIHDEVRKVLPIFDRPAPQSYSDNLILRLEYAKASALASILTKLLGNAGKGEKEAEKLSVVADESTNTLIVSTDPKRFDEIRSLVAMLDVRSKQVLVKALIMEVTLRKGDSMGVSWQYNAGQGQVQSNMNTPLSSSPFSAVQNDLQGLKYAFLNPDRFNAFLNTIVTGSKVNILSSPHIMTVNNKPAEIIVGQEVPYTKDSRVSDTQAVIKTNEYRKVGIKLSVTPQITNRNDVVLDIIQEISGLSGVDAGLDAPIFFTREAKATVIVGTGQTVVIAGLIKHEKTETSKKIPILGDLPLIKNLFRSKERSSEKTELIAFITPLVIDSDARAEEVTEAMRDDYRTRLRDKGFRTELDAMYEWLGAVAKKRGPTAAPRAYRMGEEIRNSVGKGKSSPRTDEVAITDEEAGKLTPLQQRVRKLLGRHRKEGDLQ